MRGCLLFLLSAVATGLDLQWMLTLWKAGHQLSLVGIILFLGCLVLLWGSCFQIERAVPGASRSSIKSHAHWEGEHEQP